MRSATQFWSLSLLVAVLAALLLLGAAQDDAKAQGKGAADTKDAVRTLINIIEQIPASTALTTVLGNRS
jgi:hypothetical protein